MTVKPRKKPRHALYFSILGLTAVAALASPRLRPFSLPLFFGVLHFGIGYALARRGKSRPAAAKETPPDRGRWLDAEADKSTPGTLPANRWRRDPSLRPIPRDGELDAAPGPHGGLWDRDLDG